MLTFRLSLETMLTPRLSLESAFLTGLDFLSVDVGYSVEVGDTSPLITADVLIDSEFASLLTVDVFISSVFSSDYFILESSFYKTPS